jgi:hypothetical protein
MNNNSDDVTAGDVVFLAIGIVGVLTGLAGILTVTPWAAALGLLALLAGLAYFGILQAVDA